MSGAVLLKTSDTLASKKWRPAPPVPTLNETEVLQSHRRPRPLSEIRPREGRFKPTPEELSDRPVGTGAKSWFRIPESKVATFTFIYSLLSCRAHCSRRSLR